MQLNKKIKNIREYYKKTLKEFSESIGLSHQFIGNVEGGRAQITPATAELLRLKYGVNPDWLLGDSGIIFEDPEKMLEYLKKKGVLENRDEILFIIEHIQEAWEASHYTTAEWIYKLAQAFLYFCEHTKIKNLGRVIDEKDIYYLREKGIEDVLKNTKNKKGGISIEAKIDFMFDSFYKLFSEGDFKLTQDDCKNISELLIPWCFYVVLRNIRTDLSAPYIDISILSTPIPRLPERTTINERCGFVSIRGVITKEAAIGHIINMDLDLPVRIAIYFKEGIKDLYDFISLFETEDTFVEYGNWELRHQDDSDYFTYQNIEITLSKKELKDLKDLAGNIKKRKDIMYQITQEYVEKYGAV